MAQRVMYVRTYCTSVLYGAKALILHSTQRVIVGRSQTFNHILDVLNFDRAARFCTSVRAYCLYVRTGRLRRPGG